jgi:hypothetical protein
MNFPINEIKKLIPKWIFIRCFYMVIYYTVIVLSPYKEWCKDNKKYTKSSVEILRSSKKNEEDHINYALEATLHSKNQKK